LHSGRIFDDEGHGRFFRLKSTPVIKDKALMNVVCPEPVDPANKNIFLPGCSNRGAKYVQVALSASTELQKRKSNRATAGMFSASLLSVRIFRRKIIFISYSFQR